MSFVGPDTRCVGIALNSLGVAHYREAMTVFEHEDSYDEEATTATADATRAMHANSAKIFLHEAARILQCICDHDLEMATVLFNLGRVLMLREEGYDDALICLERAWQIRSHHLGQDHRDCGKTTLNAAHAWHVLGDVKTALERYEQFVRIESVQLTINQREGKVQFFYSLHLGQTDKLI